MLRSTVPQDPEVVSESEPSIQQSAKPVAPRRAPTKQSSSHDTTTPRHHDTTRSIDQADTVETIRRAVRQLGKEAATYRFTEAEKQALAQLVFAYKGKRIRTSENEITRIAINYIIEDHEQNGESSLLARVLGRLNG